MSPSAQFQKLLADVVQHGSRSVADDFKATYFSGPMQWTLCRHAKTLSKVCTLFWWWAWREQGGP